MSMPVVKIYGLSSTSISNNISISRYDILIESDKKTQRLSRSYQHITAERALLRGFLAASEELDGSYLVKLVSVTSLCMKSKENSSNSDLITKIIENFELKGCTWREVNRLGKSQAMKSHIENAKCFSK